MKARENPSTPSMPKNGGGHTSASRTKTFCKPYPPEHLAAQPARGKGHHRLHPTRTTSTEPAGTTSLPHPQPMPTPHPDEPQANHQPPCRLYPLRAGRAGVHRTRVLFPVERLEFIVKQNWFAKNGMEHRDTKTQSFIL